MNKTKTNLEELFAGMRAESENAELSLGHEERFMRKVQMQESSKTGTWNRIKTWFNDQTAGKKAGWVLAPAVCALAVVLLIAKTGNINRMEQNYLLSLQEYGRQLTEDGKNLSPEDQIDLEYSISSIVSEEQLMAIQLPANLSKKEKQKIIKEYYNQKMEGLKKIKTFIAMNNENEE